MRFDKKAKRPLSVDETKFFLLHLGLLREYLEMEFIELADSLSFKYDMEKVIDDWIFMCFMVGNDFIPHLPNLHISSNALPLLYKIYRNVLPKLDGELRLFNICFSMLYARLPNCSMQCHWQSQEAKCLRKTLLHFKSIKNPKLSAFNPFKIGYLTDAGKINLKRFEIFMEEMGEIDRDLFREHYADLQQLELKYVSI